MGVAVSYERGTPVGFRVGCTGAVAEAATAEALLLMSEVPLYGFERHLGDELGDGASVVLRPVHRHHLPHVPSLEDGESA